MPNLQRVVRKIIHGIRFQVTDQWRRVELFDLGSVGDRVRLVGPVSFGSEPYLVHIGDYVTISSEVQFVTHDGGVGIFREEHPGLNLFGEIHVGDHVFVGARTTVLPGVRIGSNVVIGAGSIVARDIPDNTVAAGVPCRPIRPIDEYRDRAIERGFSVTSSGEQRRRDILRGLAERQGAHVGG